MTEAVSVIAALITALAGSYALIVKAKRGVADDNIVTMNRRLSTVSDEAARALARADLLADDLVLVLEWCTHVRVDAALQGHPLPPLPTLRSATRPDEAEPDPAGGAPWPTT